MKKNKVLSWALIGLMVVLLLGCGARFYTPNRNPVPMFKNAGDLYVDASTNMYNKVDITAGFAPINGVGTYIGYNHASQRESNGFWWWYGSDVIHYNQDMLNLGLGYFLSENISRRFRFEVYGDMAFGSFRNKIIDGPPNFFNGRFQRIGIMPNIGYNSFDHRFEFAYSMRISQLSFSQASISDKSYWSYDLERYNSRKSYGMVEQAFNFRFGSERLKFQLQMATYHGLKISSSDHSAIPSFNYTLMFGLVITPNLYR